MGFPTSVFSGTSFNFLIWKNESNQTHVSGQTLREGLQLRDQFPHHDIKVRAMQPSAHVAEVMH